MKSFLVVLLLVGIANGQSAAKPASELMPVPAADGDQNHLIVVHADVPLYPEIAEAARISGVIRLQVSVKSGTVVRVESGTSGPTILVQAAIENVKTWRFISGTYGIFNVTYIYEIEDHEVSARQNPRIEMRLPSLVRVVARPVKATTVN